MVTLSIFTHLDYADMCAFVYATATYSSCLFKLSFAKGGRFPSSPHIHDLETGTLLNGPRIHGSGLDSALGLENFNNSTIDFCG